MISQYLIGLLIKLSVLIDRNLILDLGGMMLKIFRSKITSIIIIVIIAIALSSSISYAQSDSDWSQYYSIEYGFSVEYPQKWLFYEVEPDAYRASLGFEAIISFYEGPESSIHIDVINVDETMTLLEWFENYETQLTTQDVELQTGLEINGNDAIYYYRKIYGNIGYTHVTLLKVDNEFFRFEYLDYNNEAYLDIYQHLLNSFSLGIEVVNENRLFDYVSSNFENNIKSDSETDDLVRTVNLPCSVTLFSQQDPDYQPNLYTASCYTSKTMAQGGCAITSLAMMLKYYGVDTNPRILDDTLGVSGCPLSSHWSEVATVGGAGSDVSFVQAKDGAQWSLLEADIADGEPVVVRYYRSSDGANHYVLAISGSGSSASNYTIADSWDGTTKSMQSYIDRGYSFAGVIRYTGTPHCLQDNTPPTNPTSITPGCTATNGSWQNTCNNTNFSWSGATDVGTGVAGYQYYWGTSPTGTSTSYTTGTSYNPVAVGDGTYYFRIRTKDNAGNYAAWKTMFVLKYDGTSPTGTLQINDDHTLTYRTLVTLNPSGLDALSGARLVRFRDQGGVWTDWQGIVDTDWILPAVTGHSYVVEAEFQDAAGNVSSLISDEIYLDIYPDRPSSTNYTLQKSTFGMSATNASSSQYQLSGTLSQPSAIGSHETDNYKLSSGFWSWLFDIFTGPEADLSVSKSASAAAVYTGQEITYTLDVHNAGPDAAEDIEVVDTLPVGVTYQSSVASGWSCGETAGVVTCTSASLDADTSSTIAITVLAPSSTGVITNNVDISSVTDDYDLSNNTDSAEVEVIAYSDLSISKTASVESIAIGAQFSYSIEIQNIGPGVANNLTMVDTLPSGVSYVSVADEGWDCAHESGVVTCDLASLNTGSSSTITIDVTAPTTAGTITNNASVTSSIQDNNLTNNDVSEDVLVLTEADLAITKTASSSIVTVGTDITYTITVQNLGETEATGITVEDVLPEEVSLVSINGTGWDCDNGTVSCTLNSLTGGASSSITLIVTAPETEDVIENSAQVFSEMTEGDLSNNTSDCSVTVREEITEEEFNYIPIFLH